MTRLRHILRSVTAAGAAVLIPACAAGGAAQAPGGDAPHRAASGLGLLAVSSRPIKAPSTSNGLAVYVGYAEDKETNNPIPATFPVPWAGAPNTTFLGGSVPGQAACGTLALCYDTGAIRLDNPGTAPITVDRVSVDMHSVLPGGKVFNNLWGSFTVAPGRSVILAANPPATNPSYDNFDTSGYPGNQCTPLTVAPTVTITVAGVPTTLVDSTHVLDTGGIDAGYCKLNESTQWRPIGSPGTNSATLTLGPPTSTAFTGQQVSETATLLDGGGAPIPNATVHFAVTSGPNAGSTADVVTDATGAAVFGYTSSRDGEDVVVASVTTVGTFKASPSRVDWVDDSAASWTGVDIGNATPAGNNSLNSGTGAWTIQGGGAPTGTGSDQLHMLSRPVSASGGVAARLTSLSGPNTATEAGVSVRTDLSAGSPYYAAQISVAGMLTVRARLTANAPPTTVLQNAVSTPEWLWIARTGSSYTTYTSSDGYTFTPVPGSATALSLGSMPVAGLTVDSTDATQLATANLDNVMIDAPVPAPVPAVVCPAPWTCADIGSPTPAGSDSFDPNTGTWTINAGGSDISGTTDSFRFDWQQFTGNVSVIADVTTQSVSSSQAKAGVMIRASTDPAAVNYAVVVSPGAGIKVQRRSATGVATTKLANPTGTVPVYLKVTRNGSVFTAYTSTDGVAWTLIPGSTTTMTMPATTLDGLAVTSHNSAVLGTVTMTAISEP